MNFLGLFASAIFIWAVLGQIVKIRRTKSADDISKSAAWMWVIGLGIYTYISIETNAHWLFGWNYAINTVLYAYLLYLVYEYQKPKQPPKQKGKFTVHPGGK